jgi:pimeloyl-ACP methyl ester carboxylesterase
MSALAVTLLVVACAVVGIPALFVAVVAFTYVRRAIYLALGGHPYSIPVAALALIIVREALTTLRVLGWSLTRRGERLGVPESAHERSTPVVLVHGLSADGTSMFAMRALLHARGRKTVAPHMGLTGRRIEKYAERLVKTLETIEGNFDVVAHSMGGIVLRRALMDRPDLAARIERLVCVASPHLGTLAATRIPIPEARQLVPNSAWLQTVPTLRALLPNATITTIASTTDAVVYPHSTTVIEGAIAHELKDIGHAETLIDPRALAIVIEALT